MHAQGWVLEVLRFPKLMRLEPSFGYSSFNRNPTSTWFDMHNLRLTLSFPVTVCVKIDPAGVAIAEGHIADVLNKKYAGELLFGGQLLRHAVDQFQTLLATHLDVADGEVFVNAEIRDDNTVDETVAVKLEEYEP